MSEMNSAKNLCFDIETGPLPEDELRAVFTPPTFEEFAADCDQRWKPETVKAKFDEASRKAWQRFVDGAALSAVTGRVLAIGVCQGRGSEPWIIGTTQTPEYVILSDFWDLCCEDIDYQQKLIGFNIFGFDLPFLIRRSWVNRIAVPGCVLVNNRNWAAIFIDLMHVWGCGVYGERIKLDSLAKFFGIDGKTGRGADFARLWLGSEEEHQQAVTYLHRDIEITRVVAVRMGVIEESK